MTKITTTNLDRVRRLFESGYNATEIMDITGYSRTTIWRMSKKIRTPGIEKIPQDTKKELLELLKLGTPSQKSRRKERKYILKAINLIKKLG